jgi:flagellar motility protein MotE (MotC chaperone)
VLNKVFNLVGMLAVATVLAAGGFAGFLYATGRLNPARIQLLGAVLRGELDDHRPEVVADGAATPAQSEEVRANSADEARAMREREHLERLEIERALSDLEAQRRLLGHALHQVVTEQETLDDEQSAFAEQRNKVLTAAEDEGFQKELEYVASLSPRQAKEYIARVWKRSQADAVRLFNELDPGRGRRILEQFKTPEELEMMTDMLEQIRLQGMEGYANQPGKAGGERQR